jgi:two-component system CheB/CheR fusion protein
MDIDVRKRTAALMRDVGEYATKFLGAIHHPLLMVDGKFRIVWANEAYYHRFQVVPEETIGSSFPGSGDTPWSRAHVRDRLDQTLQTGQILRDYMVPEEGKRAMRLGASRVPVASDSMLLLLSIEEE